MSQVTNASGLPQALVDAVANDDYEPGDGDTTVTELISPPRLAALRRANKEFLSEDVADRIWSLFGQVTHGILERANKLDLAEKRFYTTANGWKVGGKLDSLLLEDKRLIDWKVTSVWKFAGNKFPVEYEQQLNLLRLILHDNAVEVDSIAIVGLLRDWSKPESKRSSDYPKSQVIVRQFPLWSIEQARAYLEERVRLHKEARALVEAGQEPPLCSDEERWVRPTMYAVKSAGAKRAAKVFDNPVEAQAMAEAKGMAVEVREGENIRCAMYCSVAHLCSWGRVLLTENDMSGL